MSRWGKRTIQGIEFDLTHLDDAVIDIVFTPANAGDLPVLYRVLVSYGPHCFARDVQHDDHVDFHIRDNGDTRCLCPTRTALSKHLPRIIREAANARAYFSEGANMLLVEELEGLAGPYAVFFNVSKSRKRGLDVVLFVVSAYEKAGLPERLPAVQFKALIAKAAKGHAPFRPQKTKRWSTKK